MRLRLRDRDLAFERGRPHADGDRERRARLLLRSRARAGWTSCCARPTRCWTAGAALIDVGGESGRSDRAPVSEDEEASRIVPLVERLAGEGVAVSVDTWRAGPARAALDAGAAMLNDVSAMSDPVLADLCAAAGAGTGDHPHARARRRPRTMPGHGDVVADVAALLGRADGHGGRSGAWRARRCCWTRAWTWARRPPSRWSCCGGSASWSRWGAPCCWRSRARTSSAPSPGARPPRATPPRSAAIEPALGLAGAVLRVHDVAAAADFLAVRAALRGDGDVPDAALDPALRTEALA